MSSRHGGKREGSGRKPLSPKSWLEARAKRQKYQANWTKDHKRIYLDDSVYQTWKRLRAACVFPTDTTFAQHLLSLELQRRASLGITTFESAEDTIEAEKSPASDKTDESQKETGLGENVDGVLSDCHEGSVTSNPRNIDRQQSSGSDTEEAVVDVNSISRITVGDHDTVIITADGNVELLRSEAHNLNSATPLEASEEDTVDI